MFNVGFFEQWGSPGLLERCGEDASVERCVDNVCEVPVRVWERLLGEGERGLGQEDML